MSGYFAGDVAPLPASGLGAADGEADDAHGRLTDADGDRLAVLAAGADTRVQRHVVAEQLRLYQTDWAADLTHIYDAFAY